MFNAPAAVSKWFSDMEQRGVFDRVVELIFGHYSDQPQPLIDDILGRIGDRHSIPVVRCGDFGHCANNAIMPIGARARLDADAFTLLESGVS